MNLVNKTSTITVAVVAAIVALAVAAHGSGALRLSPAHAAVHGTEQGTAARSGSPAGGSGNGQGSGSAGATLSGGSAGGSDASQAGACGTVLWSQTVTATDYPGFPGGALYAQTPIGDCSSDPGTTNNDYVIAYDTVSGRWSNELPIDSDCASF